MPSSEEAVPAVRGCAPRARAVSGGTVAETVATSTNKETSAATRGKLKTPAASRPTPLMVRAAMPAVITVRSPQDLAARPPSRLNTITPIEFTPKA